jgi:hypothetical protein
LREAYDCARRQHDFCTQIFSSNRRCRSVPNGKRGAFLPGTHAWGALEFAATAQDVYYQGRSLQGSLDAVSSLLVCLAHATARPLGTMGEQACRASRQRYCHHRSGQKARRNPVRHLAGWNHVHPGEVQHVGGQCNTCHRPCSNDQPTSRGGNRVGHIMASDPRIAWTMSPRFAAPLTDFNLCASSANTRFGCQLFPWPPGEQREAQCGFGGTDLSLTGGPLHTCGQWLSSPRCLSVDHKPRSSRVGWRLKPSARRKLS